MSKKSKTIRNDDILILLKEAKHITLDDLNFDNILKEQKQILCNINTILKKENKDISELSNSTQQTSCNINNLKNDTKFKNILSKYKLSAKKHKIKEPSGKKTKYNLPIKNIHSSMHLQVKKTKTKPHIKSHNPINKLTKQNSKSKYDISITNPNIYIRKM